MATFSPSKAKTATLHHTPTNAPFLPTTSWVIKLHIAVVFGEFLVAVSRLPQPQTDAQSAPLPTFVLFLGSFSQNTTIILKIFAEHLGDVASFLLKYGNMI